MCKNTEKALAVLPSLGGVESGKFIVSRTTTAGCIQPPHLLHHQLVCAAVLTCNPFESQQGWAEFDSAL
jgi:hypothetical protein